MDLIKSNIDLIKSNIDLIKYNDAKIDKINREDIDKIYTRIDKLKVEIKEKEAQDKIDRIKSELEKKESQMREGIKPKLYSNIILCLKIIKSR